MNELVQEEVFQAIQISYPSRRADDNALRAVFTLNVKDGAAIAMSGGAIWKGFSYIGSFDGLVGFQHNISGADAAAADELLANLSIALSERYVLPIPETGAEGGE